MIRDSIRFSREKNKSFSEIALKKTSERKKFDSIQSWKNKSKVFPVQNIRVGRVEISEIALKKTSERKKFDSIQSWKNKLKVFRV